MKITALQRFSTKDGYGVRTVLFAKGCPLRCRWCHNPETQKPTTELMYAEKLCIGCRLCEHFCKRKVHSFENAAHRLDRSRCACCGDCAENCPTGALTLSGEEMSVDALFNFLQKDRDFFGETGGVTLSGGEPMMQARESLLLLRRCREAKIGTAVETCGYFDAAFLPELVDLCDLFLFDWKLSDDALHRKMTGVSNRLILQNLLAAAALGARIRLRCILLEGINTNLAHYEKILAIAREIPRLDGVEFLPYHTYGSAKSIQLGEEDSASEALIPREETLNEAKTFFERRKIRTEF